MEQGFTAEIVTCVRVRSISDITWEESPTDQNIYVLPHYSLPEELRSEMISKIKNRHPELMIYIDRNEGFRNINNLGTFKKSTVLVMIHSMDDIRNISVRGPLSQRTFLFPQFTVKEDFKEKMFRKLPNIGLLFLDFERKHPSDIISRVIKWSFLLLGLYLVMSRGVMISNYFRNSTPPVLNITVPNFSVGTFAVENFNVVGKNIIKDWIKDKVMKIQGFSWRNNSTSILNHLLPTSGIAPRSESPRLAGKEEQSKQVQKASSLAKTKVVSEGTERTEKKRENLF